MNDKEFFDRLKNIQQTLVDTHFLKYATKNILTEAELANLYATLSNTACSTAIQMQELDLKKQASSLEQEKARQELEMMITRQKLENLKIQADIASAVVQAESVKRSVRDNAAINKANAMIGYFNVAMNAVASNSASLTTTLRTQTQETSKVISLIDTSELDPRFANTLSGILDQAVELKNFAKGNKQVGIIAPKTTIEIGENVTLLGFSVFGDNECEFVDDDEIIKSKFYVFAKDKVGKYDVIFRAKNDKDKFISAKVKIKVVKRGEK